MLVTFVLICILPVLILFYFIEIMGTISLKVGDIIELGGHEDEKFLCMITDKKYRLDKTTYKAYLVSLNKNVVFYSFSIWRGNLDFSSGRDDSTTIYLYADAGNNNPNYWSAYADFIRKIT